MPPARPSSISLNTDIGEGFGPWRIAEDEALLGLVSDANLACGFHASDPDIMRATCRTAAEKGVSVAAQVGYPDLRGFGRRYIDMDPRSIVNDVLYQLGALEAFQRVEGLKVAYLKVHGALYHAAVSRPDYAEAIVEAVTIFDPVMPVMCQPGTTLSARVEAAGLPMIREGYVDRAYTADGLLVPRGQPGAVITDVSECAARAVRLARDGLVTCADGSSITMAVDSLCIHSDSPGAPEIAHAVRAALESAGVEVKALV